MTPRPWLRLARIPNVFTAFADAVTGVALARGGRFEPRDLLLMTASGALYMAGMVLNDYFDRAVDARERPERPIPAGEVPAAGAAAVGGMLAAGGLALAAAHGGPALSVALALTLTVVLYDAWLKATPLGPWAMGACRGLNVALGMSAAPWPRGWLWAAPLVLFAFTLLITRLSRFEVFGAAPERLRATLYGLGALGLAWLVALAAVRGRPSQPQPQLDLALAGIAAFVAWRGRELFAPLWREVSPARLGRAIGGGILLMPAVDAGFVLADGAPLLAAGVFCLALPAYLLKRWYYLT